MDLFPRLKDSIKQNLFFGLLTFVPAYITILIILKVIGFFDSFSSRIYHGLRLPEFMVFLTYPAAGAVLSFIFLVIVGFLSRQYMGKQLMRLVDKMFALIPMSRQIYSAIKKMTQSFFDSEHSRFQKVVFVPFPHKDVYAIAFLTGESPAITDGERFYYVYVPTAINPTSGFLISVKESLIVHSSMKVEEAFALILSGGMANPCAK